MLRKADFSDIPLLRRWDEAPHVLASGVEDWDWEEMLSTDPKWRQMLIAEIDGKPIGFMQIIDPALEDTAYWGDCGPDLRAIDIWIGEADFIRRGYGTAMMTQAIDGCFAEGAKAILIDPLATNKNAHRFYEALGFQFIETRWFDEDFCHVYRHDRANWSKKTNAQSAKE